MRLDVNALGTFYRMAREGAGIAAGRLTRMTDVQTRVGITKLNFVRGEEIRRDFADDVPKVGVRVELSGGIQGDSVIVFNREAALNIVRTLLPDQTGDDGGEFDDMTRSAVEEVGQIMNNGFIDGWADVLGTAIDVTTPEFVTGETHEPFIGDLDTAPDDEDLALLFQSQIEAVGTEFGFRHYLLPDHDSMETVLRRQGDPNATGIEYDKLAGFDRLAQQGAREVASNVTTLTGIETRVEIRRLNFVSLETIPEEIGMDRKVAVAFSFDGTPSGYLVFVFDEGSAREVVEATIPSPPDDEFGELGTSAIKELGNIMASGFLDGWANVLDTTIDHSTPEFIHDIGPAVIDPVIIDLGDNQDFAFVFDTQIKADDREFDVDIYAIPDEADLERALNDLDVSKIDDTQIKADFPIDEVETT